MRSDLAFLAASRWHQFPRHLRSRDPNVATDGGCVAIGAGLHQCLRCRGTKRKRAAALGGGTLEGVTFHHIPTNEPWCRDHGPIFLTRAEDPRLAIVDWEYNAWGWKYPPFEDDDVVPTRIAEKLDLAAFYPENGARGRFIEVTAPARC